MKKLTAAIALFLAFVLSLSACVAVPDTISAAPSEKSVYLYEGESAKLSYTFSEDLSELDEVQIKSSASAVAEISEEKPSGNKLSFTLTAKETGSAEIYPIIAGKDFGAEKIALTVKEAPSSDGGITEDVNEPYTVLNGGVPEFLPSEYTTEAFERYSPLDTLGRCGVVFACLGIETMPKDDEERGSISNVTPTGWVQASYDFVSGKYLYNRSHLIGWQLSAENDNERNLITGTRYFNVDGMLPFENMVADYIKETGNHVLYRVTPRFSGDNLLASGVQIEAFSVEDEGDGISFNVFVYNIQPGVKINYRTGASELDESGNAQIPEIPEQTTPDTPSGNTTYILNTSSKKFHREDCTYAKNMSDANREEFHGEREELIDDGYSPCGTCKP